MHEYHYKLEHMLNGENEARVSHGHTPQTESSTISPSSNFPPEKGSPSSGGPVKKDQLTPDSPDHPDFPPADTGHDPKSERHGRNIRAALPDPRISTPPLQKKESVFSYWPAADERKLMTSAQKAASSSGHLSSVKEKNHQPLAKTNVLPTRKEPSFIPTTKKPGNTATTARTTVHLTSLKPTTAHPQTVTLPESTFFPDYFDGYPFESTSFLQVSIFLHVCWPC